jgi:hypothetical protein
VDGVIFGIDAVLKWRPGRFLAEPHAVDRVTGGPVTEPVIVGHRDATQS